MTIASRPHALGIDTTHATLRLGLTNFDDLDRHQAWPLGRQLSVQFHQILGEFLTPQTWGDLTWIAVARGPGSFTSTRIGFVTATTLAQQLQIPLYPISTLAQYAAAQQCIHSLPDTTILAVEMPGQRGQIHGGIYQVGAQQCEALICDRQWSLADWEHLCTQHEIHHRLPTHTSSLSDTALSQALLTLGHQHWHQGRRPHWEQAHPYTPSRPDQTAPSPH